ncbi:MAG: MFS transporter [Anaerolineales bacterium]|nr:MFS transporter [Anaerolineales bacterium]
MKARTAGVWRVLIPIGLGTTLSLLGDTAMYAVLPTHTAALGVTVASVGILLSANRWIRLALNNVAGVAYDRWPRRWLFVTALFVGALSTALYAFAQGFWPLVIARLLWGAAWSGIWVGGNTIILDVATDRQRGRWAGLYQLSFYLGGVLGFPIGGLLTDALGFRAALAIAAGVGVAGAVLALLFLPETRGASPAVSVPAAPADTPPPEVTAGGWPGWRDPIVLATVLYSANRFVLAGLVSATLALLVQARWGETRFNGVVIGVATVTGGLLGVNTLVSMLAAPLAGHYSDRAQHRGWVAGLGLAGGALGLGILAGGPPAALLPGVALCALAGGATQSVSTALLGDVTAVSRRGRTLGWMHTFGDLSSAIAPPLAYALLPGFGLAGLYWACALGLGALAAWTLRLARAPHPAAA